MTEDGTTITTRPIALGAILTCVALALSGCAEGTPVQPKEAKHAIVSIVDRSTDALGGDWDVDSGPGLGTCSDGITYVYIKKRAAGDVTADTEELERLWNDRGITTRRFNTGGDDPISGVDGAGGPTTSISFTAAHGQYTIDGESECAEGDFVKMVEDGNQ